MHPALRHAILQPWRTGNGVVFDGTNDFMARGANLTGIANSAQGICSCWVRINGGDAAQQLIFQSNTAGLFDIYRNSSNKFYLKLFSAGYASGLTVPTTTSYTTSPTWRHLLFSWDTDFAAASRVAHMYINDVSDKGTADNDYGVAFSVTYADETNWSVGASQDTGADKANMDMAELWFLSGVFLDFSLVENRRKFITQLGKPADLGGFGENPLGTRPLVYFKGPADAFNVNRGTGGNFTVTGTLDNGATSPSGP